MDTVNRFNGTKESEDSPTTPKVRITFAKAILFFSKEAGNWHTSQSTVVLNLDRLLGYLQ